MKNTKTITQILFSMSILAAGLGLPGMSNADFDIISRRSELSLASTNLGGIQIDIESTDTNVPFAASIFDSTTHEEPGGNINGGVWSGFQESSTSAQQIRAQLHSEVATEQLFGLGIPVLNMLNQFEVEFEVDQAAEVELGGTILGNADVIGAANYVNFRLQFHNGVTFFTMFNTTTLDDFNDLFLAELQPGVLYRLTVVSHANAIGQQTGVSAASICLRERFSAGDMNQDGVVNLLDVALFVEAITVGDYDGQADVNCDGLLNLSDVAPFVDILGSN